MLQPEGFGAARPVDVPLLIGASGPKGLAVAAELGDGVFSAGAPSTDAAASHCGGRCSVRHRARGGGGPGLGAGGGGGGRPWPPPSTGPTSGPGRRASTGSPAGGRGARPSRPSPRGRATSRCTRGTSSPSTTGTGWPSGSWPRSSRPSVDRGGRGSATRSRRASRRGRDRDRLPAGRPDIPRELAAFMDDGGGLRPRRGFAPSVGRRMSPWPTPGCPRRGGCTREHEPRHQHGGDGQDQPHPQGIGPGVGQDGQHDLHHEDDGEGHRDALVRRPVFFDGHPPSVPAAGGGAGSRGRGGGRRRGSMWPGFGRRPGRGLWAGCWPAIAGLLSYPLCISWLWNRASLSPICPDFDDHECTLDRRTVEVTTGRAVDGNDRRRRSTTTDNRRRPRRRHGAGAAGPAAARSGRALGCWRLAATVRGPTTEDAMPEAVIVVDRSQPDRPGQQGVAGRLPPRRPGGDDRRAVLGKVPGARPPDRRRPHPRLRPAGRRVRLQHRPRHRPARRHARRARRDRQPVLLVVAAGDPDGGPRREGRRGRRLHLRRAWRRSAASSSAPPTGDRTTTLFAGAGEAQRGAHPAAHHRGSRWPACPTSTSPWVRRRRTYGWSRT